MTYYCPQQELIAVKNSKSKSKAASLFAWFSESVTAVSQSLGGAEIPKTKADEKFNTRVRMSIRCFLSSSK